MKKGWLIAIGVAGGLLGAGLLSLAFGPPRGAAVQLLPPPSPQPLSVHVSGAVSSPGVYSLPAGSRVQDAIQAADGLLPDANPNSLNLAAFLEDGVKLIVPFVVPTSAGITQGEASPALAPTPGFPININSASLEDLDRLPGIGPVKAQSILTYREANGPFSKIEDIIDVSGIGTATFENIKDLIIVEG
jgi:competence protein ComEA